MSKKTFTGILMILVLALITAACSPQAPDETSAPATDSSTVSEPIEEEHEEGMTEESSEAEASESAMEESSAAGMVAFGIVQTESEARFTLDEVLRGNPKTVVGVTDQVTGEFEVDFDNPASSLVGEIQINADTLTTDNNFRNGAIQKFI
ncbi:MAG: hypothetical protein ISS57_14410 [Anaerolineales bacterium]|nr:hypothetical protein [Anaerolineales bacterium]